MIYSAIKGDDGDAEYAVDLCIASLEEQGYGPDLNVNVRVDSGVYYVVAFPVDGETGEPIGKKIQTFPEQLADLGPVEPFD